MYSNHSDPYAGQYPPPPPLADHTPQYFDQPQPVYHVSAPSMPQEPYYPDVHQPMPHVSFDQEHYTPPPLHNAVYTPPVQARPEYSHTPTMYDEEATTQHNEASLEDYLKTEREEYMKHQPQTYNEPEKQTEEYQELLVDSDKPLSRKEAKKLKKQQEKEEAMRNEYQPYVAHPTVAPQNEAETYRVDPYQKKKSRNCCCYNPALTCCSCFFMLVNIAFLAGGIAMMIASKVVTDKCNNECGEVYETAQEACGKLCSKVVHDVMLYGGAVVTGLAGIAVIWRAVMWTCAGYSKR
ncbi:unnamed protein product [Rhizopus stolonifer]